MTIDETIVLVQQNIDLSSTDNGICDVDKQQLVNWLIELKKYHLMFTTADGVLVHPGDTIWVNGSTKTSDATVRTGVTSYEYFGPIPVQYSYSSEETAVIAREKNKKVKL